jgi:molecular chaperone GrpE
MSDDTNPKDTAAPEAASGPAPVAERTFTEREVADLVAAKESEMQDRFLRLAAEYQNFRRRVEREREQVSDEVLERFAGDLLPVLDSFERALAARGKDPSAAVSGLELVEKQLRAALEKHGMTPIEAAGAAFDPRFHEALFRTPTTEKPAGTVLAVLERGWQMRSRLLRPARVQVAAPAE